MRQITITVLAGMLISALLWTGAAAVAPPGQSSLRRDSRVTGEQRDGEEEEAAKETPATALAAGSRLERAVDPASYVLGPFDELALSIIGPAPRAYSLMVLPEGDVLIPEIGPIHADGLTLEEFRRALVTKVGAYFRNVEIYCYLTKPAEFRVFVTGEVENPGAVAVSGVERITDAIEKAGSVKGNGSLRLISLERKDETMRVDILRFVTQGDLANNPFLRSGDRIHVPPVGWRALIHGQVKKPGTYEILEEETVADLIELAGGFTTDAIEDSVLVSQRAMGVGGGASTETIKRSQFGLRLNDMDEVGVFDKFKRRFAVRVEGATNRTGRFYLAPNEGIAELVVRAGGFPDRADLSSAYVSRANGAIVKVDLRAYLPPDPERRFALEDGDVLTIPEVRSTVTVGGEVNTPGEFKYSGDLTVIQYIGLAGGPSKDGSAERVVIYAPDGTSRAAGKDDHPNRGEVVIVKKSGFKIFGSLFDGLLRIGTLVVSILILSE